MRNSKIFFSLEEEDKVRENLCIFIVLLLLYRQDKRWDNKGISLSCKNLNFIKFLLDRI